MMRLAPDFLTRPFAHRGYHDRRLGIPENSRAAFEAAIRHGYGIELDLQPSADGVAMVFHDYDLQRLTGTPGLIQNRNADDLANIHLTGSTEGVPTLKDILQLVDGRTPLLIEFKDQDGDMGTNVGPLEHAAATLLKSYAGPFALMSFNPHSMVAIADHLPDIARGIVTDSFSKDHWPELSDDTRRHLRKIPDYTRTGASFISHQASDLHAPRVADLKAKGANILCWTIRSPAQATKVLEIADNITFESYPASFPK